MYQDSGLGFGVGVSVGGLGVAVGGTGVTVGVGCFVAVAVGVGGVVGSLVGVEVEVGCVVEVFVAGMATVELALVTGTVVMVLVNGSTTVGDDPTVEVERAGSVVAEATGVSVLLSLADVRVGLASATCAAED